MEAKKTRRDRVERSRREYVNEMLLEPIMGLSPSDYACEPELPSEMGYQAMLGLAVELEASTQRLYLAAIEKIKIPQLARVFRRLARENAENELQLRSLHDRRPSEA